MNRRMIGWLVAVALTVTGLFVWGSPANADVTEGIPALVEIFEPTTRTETYPAVDYGKKSSPKDDRHAKTTWRVVEGTGNCCETYLTTTASGRLLDFGGSYIHYTDDRGLNWRRVKPLTPLVNGEGAIVAAPGGDVLGVEWDPYTGDHLQFYKYEADTQQWRYTEMVIHQPFYDREWIAVVPGPVTIDGETHEYVSFVKGGWPTKEAWYYSTDGLNYTNVTSKAAEQMLNNATRQEPLMTAAHPHNDWVQPNTEGRMTPLGSGKLLSAPDLSSEWSLFDGDDFSWSAYRLPNGEQPSGRFQVDSAGRVHNVIPSGDGAGFTYRVSTDGGASWQTTDVALPAGHVIEELDFRANLAAGVAAVAMRAQDGATDLDQDLVYKFDITGDRAFLQRRYEVGLGDTGATGGFGNEVRFDFESVTIFPDGRVAVSFLDSTTGPEEDDFEPAVAIELETAVGTKIKERAETAIDPVLGEPYSSYTFDQDAEGWTTSGVPTWTRQQPGSRDGTDDSESSSFAIWGPTEYVNSLNASLTSPPVATEAGFTVLEFWLKSDTEPGFDFVNVEWRSADTNWQTLARFSGRNESFPDWEKVTLGFDSPGGDVQVRFRFTSDLICSALDPLCGEFTGARVDEVVIGKQAE